MSQSVSGRRPVLSLLTHSLTHSRTRRQAASPRTSLALSRTLDRGRRKGALCSHYRFWDVYFAVGQVAVSGASSVGHWKSFAPPHKTLCSCRRLAPGKSFPAVHLGGISFSREGRDRDNALSVCSLSETLCGKTNRSWPVYEVAERLTHALCLLSLYSLHALFVCLFVSMYLRFHV